MAQSGRMIAAFQYNRIRRRAYICFVASMSALPYMDFNVSHKAEAKTIGCDSKISSLKCWGQNRDALPCLSEDKLFIHFLMVGG